MFRTILVPLDGSIFAEQALPHALAVVRRAGAALDLVRVHILYLFEEHMVARYSYDPETDAEHRRKELLYLEGTAKWLAAVSPVPATAAVVNGPEADGILQRARDIGADLIVLTTHSRGPVGRALLGSVADEIVRRAEAPVLLVPPLESPPGVVPEPPLEHVLVPLDGSDLAERALNPALELGRLWEGRLTLLRVVEAGQDQEEARAYLEKVAGRFWDEGVSVRTRVVGAAHAAPAILEEAQGQGCDLIALATHGRGGLRRMLLGSVADRVIRGATTPVLVCRPTND